MTKRTTTNWQSLKFTLAVHRVRTSLDDLTITEEPSDRPMSPEEEQEWQTELRRHCGDTPRGRIRRVLSNNAPHVQFTVDGEGPPSGLQVSTMQLAEAVYKQLSEQRSFYSKSRKTAEAILPLGIQRLTCFMEM